MTSASIAESAAAPAPPSPLREFWSYFSANHGAVEHGVQRPRGAVGEPAHIRARIAAVAPRR